MPGVGVGTAAGILLDVGDASLFPTAGHLAAYAGLAPVTRRSGTSIRGEFPARSGNKHLKRALFLSAFAALRSDPVSRAYYNRKRAQGKKHNAALICLARRRCNVLHATLRNQSPTESPPQHPTRRPLPLDPGDRGIPEKLSHPHDKTRPAHRPQPAATTRWPGAKDRGTYPRGARLLSVCDSKPSTEADTERVAMLCAGRSPAVVRVAFRVDFSPFPMGHDAQDCQIVNLCRQTATT